MYIQILEHSEENNVLMDRCMQVIHRVDNVLESLVAMMTKVKLLRCLLSLIDIFYV
jgi:hypothetical protein